MTISYQGMPLLSEKKTDPEPLIRLVHEYPYLMEPERRYIISNIRRVYGELNGGNDQVIER